MEVHLRNHWLGDTIEDELTMAVDFWEDSRERRSAQSCSQTLKSMFEDDGSNLRVHVQTGVGDNTNVQLREVGAFHVHPHVIFSYTPLVHPDRPRRAHRGHCIGQRYLHHSEIRDERRGTV